VGCWEVLVVVCEAAAFESEPLTAVVRGGGDLATGTAICLHRARMRVIVTELAAPLAVRRAVSFAEAIYEGSWTVEDVEARRATSTAHAIALARQGIIPVLVAPDLLTLDGLCPDVLVDARLTKYPPEPAGLHARMIIGLGPGFTAGLNCDAVVETQRGHTLGRVYWAGTTLADTGMPDGDPRRVLRAPVDGVLRAEVGIGELVEAGERVANVDGHPISSPFAGVVRGLIRDGVYVRAHVKIGDVDASGDRSHCFLVSDKALAIGGAVLGAILARSDAGRPVRG
jgi:xanthine dehydrogenase accessory factor